MIFFASFLGGAPFNNRPFGRKGALEKREIGDEAPARVTGGGLPKDGAPSN